MVVGIVVAKAVYVKSYSIDKGDSFEHISFVHQAVQQAGLADPFVKIERFLHLVIGEAAQKFVSTQLVLRLKGVQACLRLANGNLQQTRFAIQRRFDDRTERSMLLAVKGQGRHSCLQFRHLSARRKMDLPSDRTVHACRISSAPSTLLCGASSVT